MTAKKTCRVPTTAAALEPRPSARRRCTLSSTTIASSTMSPAASTSASRVRMLTEKPRSQLAANVPSSEIGMAMAGMSVSRIEPEKTRIVVITTMIEIRRVVKTSFTAPRINTASSEITESVIFSRRPLRSLITVVTPFDISMVLDPACRMIPIPTTRSPFNLTKPSASAGEKATLATSPMRMSLRTISDAISSSLVTAASARTKSC